MNKKILVTQAKKEVFGLVWRMNVAETPLKFNFSKRAKGPNVKSKKVFVCCHVSTFVFPFGPWPFGENASYIYLMFASNWSANQNGSLTKGFKPFFKPTVHLPFTKLIAMVSVNEDKQQMKKLTSHYHLIKARRKKDPYRNNRTATYDW